MIARVFFFENNSAIPDRREVVSGYMKCAGGAAGVLEVASAAVFRLIGSEQFWVPRIITVSCWMLGGILLFAAVRRLLSPEAALVAAIFHLFLPYSMAAVGAGSRTR